MNNRLVIDVGSHSIKVLEGARRKDDFVIRKAGIIENPVGTFRGEPSEEEWNTLARFLKDYLTRLATRTRDVFCSVCGDGLVVHYFDIPDLPESEIKGAVDLEILQVIPGGIQNLESDYFVFTSGAKKVVLFVGYPRERSDLYVSSLTRIGLKPFVMDVDAMALLNSHPASGGPAEEAVLMLNVGAGYTNLGIAEKDGFILIRDISFGGRNVSAALAEGRQMSPAEAEAFKKDPANAETIRGFLPSVAGEMIQEITTAVQYFENRTEKKCGHFHLAGGSARLPGLLDLLSANLGIEGRIWNPLDSVRDGVPAEIRDQGTAFSVAVGLLNRKFL